MNHAGLISILQKLSSDGQVNAQAAFDDRRRRIDIPFGEGESWNQETT